MLRRLGWPLGPFVPSLVVMVSAILTAVANMPGQGYALWVDLSAAAHNNVAAAIAVVSFASAWVGRELVHSRVLFHGAGLGARSRQLASLAVVLVISSCLGMLVGFIPRSVWTLRTATAGGPGLLEISMVPMAVTMVVVVSLVLGSLAERLAWCFVIATALTATVWFAVSVDSTFAVLTAVWLVWPGPENTANPAVVGYFMVFAATVITVSGAVFAARPRLSGRLLAVGAAAITALVIGPIVWQPQLYVAVPDVSPVCEQTDGTNVCVHPANAPDLRRLQAAASELNSGLEEPVADTVIDSSAQLDSTPKVGRILVSSSPGSAEIDARYQLVADISGEPYCWDRYPRVTDDYPAPYLVSSSLLVVLQERFNLSKYADTDRSLLSDDRAVKVFGEMSGSELGRYLVDNRRALRNCEAPMPVRR